MVPAKSVSTISAWSVSVLLMISALSCSTTPPNSSVGAEEPLRFIVGYAATGERLRSVEVVVVGSNGREVLGTTGLSGELNVSRSALSSYHGGAILFCREWFYCGAFFVDTDLLEYEERYIALTSYSVM